jgi:hypothetical protein
VRSFPSLPPFLSLSLSLSLSRARARALSLSVTLSRCLSESDEWFYCGVYTPLCSMPPTATRLFPLNPGPNQSHPTPSSMPGPTLHCRHQLHLHLQQVCGKEARADHGAGVSTARDPSQRAPTGFPLSLPPPLPLSLSLPPAQPPVHSNYLTAWQEQSQRASTWSCPCHHHHHHYRNNLQS